MRERGSVISQVDLPIVLIYTLLVVMGWFNIYAATYTETTDFTSYERQLVWIGLAFVLGFSVLIIDAKFYESFAVHIYGFFMFLLLAVLIFGSVHKGARSWFNIGSAAIQPTEFAKFSTALVLAKIMSSFKQKKIPNSIYFYAASAISIPLVLIALQPDLGSCVVFLAFYFALFREGFPAGVLIIGLTALILFLFTIFLEQFQIPVFTSNLQVSGPDLLMIGIVMLSFWVYRFTKSRKIKIPKIAFIAVVIPAILYIGFVSFAFTHLLEDRHRNRVNELLGIIHDPSGVGYNVHQSKIAIGSGGILGKGYLDGTQTKYNFVPEQRTDFIFCTIGEEWGFVGSTVVIALYLILLTLIVNSAEKQKSVFSRFYGYSVASLLFFHFAINVGMTIGLVPVIGIPLPFFSYGGSSLWAFTILLFIYLKLDSERKFILG